MDRDHRERLEKELRRLFDEGRLRDVATLAVREYGPEINGFVLGLARDETNATDAFGLFCEKLWRNLPDFRWESSFRTWVYLLARYVLIEMAAQAARRPRQMRLSLVAKSLAASVRSPTPPYRRTDVKDEFTRLRERLEPDEQTLLVLRVDRGLSWSDIVVIMDGPNEAALRKRFERVKERLKAMAKEEGLIPD